MEASNIECYCETEFIRQFIESIPVPVSNPYDDIPEFDIWRKYKKLIFNDMTLIVDSNDKIEELFRTNQENQIYLLLYKKVVGGQSEKTFSDINFTEINPHAVFFLADTQKCKQFEEDYGMLFVSNEMKNEKANILFNTGSVEIEKDKNDYKNWKDLANHKYFIHPCNSIIITDNYIVKNEKHYRDNLFALINVILPKRLNKLPFQITIIADECISEEKKKACYESIFKHLKYLKEGRGYKYDIELKIIFQTNNENHARNLITNYLRLNPDDSFKWFEENREHNKRFHNDYHLRITRNLKLSYSTIFNDSGYKKIKEQYKKYDSNKRKYFETPMLQNKEEVKNRLLN